MTGPGSNSPGVSGSMTLLELASVLLRERRLIVLTTAAVAVLTVGWVVLQPRTYTARAAFVAESPATQGILGPGGIASQLGLRAPTGSGQNPQFLASLLLSRPILEAAVLTEYESLSDGYSPQLDLIEFYGHAERGSAERRIERAVRSLRRDLEIRVRSETGVVEVGFRADEPALAGAVAGRLLDLVNEWELARRRSEAAREAAFISERLAKAESELAEEEARLERFLSENRDFSNSAELTFQHDRLQRAVAMRQRLHASLTETHEMVQLEEARAKPVITVITPPTSPAIPDPRGLVLRAALALLAGALLGVVAALLREQLRQSRERDAVAFERFRSLKAETVDELRRPFELIGREGRKKALATPPDAEDGPVR